MRAFKILVINLGSTSTKVALYTDDEQTYMENVRHDSGEIAACATINDQYDLRMAAITDFMNRYGIDPTDLDAVTTRGGHTEPRVGGTYRITEEMLDQVNTAFFGSHPSNLGSQIAFDLCAKSGHAVPLTTDMPTTDELEPLARYSGLKELPRKASFQALNHRAMAKAYCRNNGVAYEEQNIIVCMLGGGISVACHSKGRMIDGPNALTGDGPFSNNRCCTVPIGDLVRLCYSGTYDLEGMLRHINGEAGLMSYLGTADVREIMARIEVGDEYAKEVIEAMCYQTAKEIGAYSTVVCGKVDAILLVAGMANVKFITDEIEKRVGWIAPVVIMPGEREMESLGLNAYDVLRGALEPLVFVPTPNWREVYGA